MTDTSKPLFPIDEHREAMREIGERYTGRYVEASSGRRQGRAFDASFAMLAALVRRSLDKSTTLHMRHLNLLGARKHEREVLAERFDAVERRDVDRVVLALNFAEGCFSADLERL